MNKIKENWLIVIIIVLVLLFTLGGNLFAGISSLGRVSSFAKVGGDLSMMESAATSGIGIYLTPSADFAPDVLERKIVKTTGITTEVERGTFKEAETKVLNIVTSSESILLNQNVNRYDKEKKSYFVGRYTIKVDTTKYDSVVAQLKDIGEVTSFNENQQDVTGSYQNINIEIQSEKAKLKRYQQLYDETKDVEFKIQLTDRIFNQERRIKYLEDSLKNIDRKVDYSTISLTLNEKRSDYANIVFVKFSELIKGFVGSLNSLLNFLFYIIPWIAAFLIIRFVYNRIKRH